ncbi:alpha/beta fold hydrolase [Mangrovicoccus algicola]|nr:alpha/beta fold hydrolase [Mangrovicoccus algicola]
MAIPGLLSDRRVWKALETAAPGRVRHADVTRDAHIAAMAGRLLAETAGPLIVAGHSMGGRVAMEMARQAPARIRGLILANTGHDRQKPDELPRRMAKIAAGHRDMQAMVAAWLPPMLAPGRQADAALTEELAEMARSIGAQVHERQIRALLERPDAMDCLPGISCPVLLLAGSEDGWSPVAQHEEIAAALPCAELQVIAGAGHFLPVEKPAETAAAVAAWLARTERPQIAETPLLDRAASLRGYRLNKMAMALAEPANRAAFREDESAYLDRFGLSPRERAAVQDRNWEEMVRLGGNLFFILKISAIDPVPITAIGAAQAGMAHDDFLKQRLGKT